MCRFVLTHLAALFLVPGVLVKGDHPTDNKDNVRGAKTERTHSQEPSCKSLQAYYEKEWKVSQRIVETAYDPALCLEYAKETTSFFSNDATIVSSFGTSIQGHDAILDLWSSSCTTFGELYPEEGVEVERITENIDCGVVDSTGWLHGKHTSIKRRNGEFLSEYTDFFAYLAHYDSKEGWKFFYAAYMTAVAE
eukprot:CAMPEP_0171733150 /NCGR_PEP_ID=MMETSP0991-20121206/30087_1 /TAXON_ID=483369 /ORGANISM="non described non described, Strain CCMP2098" /LENGTH=192 /DNA_ID=CAMNT_0012328763 /DNA_START=152 /DNA_END=730 /DNA_ORIENTATION=-